MLSIALYSLSSLEVRSRQEAIPAFAVIECLSFDTPVGCNVEATVFATLCYSSSHLASHLRTRWSAFGDYSQTLSESIIELMFNFLLVRRLVVVLRSRYQPPPASE